MAYSQGLCVLDSEMWNEGLEDYNLFKTFHKYLTKMKAVKPHKKYMLHSVLSVCVIVSFFLTVVYYVKVQCEDSRLDGLPLSIKLICLHWRQSWRELSVVSH